jgi:hypothetical protein
MRRHSFMVQVHPGGVSILENLRTRERVSIEDLDGIGAQIERWVSDALTEGEGPGGDGLVPSEDAPGSSRPVDQGPD